MFILITAVALAIGLSLLSLVSPPEWADDLGGRSVWTKLTVGTAVATTALIIAVAFGTGTDDLWRFAVLTINAGLVGSVFFQTAVTDFKLHLADRRLFNVASPIAALVGVPYLIAKQDWLTISVVVSLVLFAAIIYLFVYSIGASDARALVLVGVGATPALGWEAFLFASLLAGSYFIIIGLTVAFKRRTLKAHFPAVPMLLFPYLLVLVAAPWVAIPSIIASSPI